MLFAIRVWLIVKYNDRLRTQDKSEITWLSILAGLGISLVPFLNFIVAIVALGEVIFDFYNVWKWINSSPFE